MSVIVILLMLELKHCVEEQLWNQKNGRDEEDSANPCANFSFDKTNLVNTCSVIPCANFSLTHSNLVNA